jgi:hypothetical protein
MASDSIIIFQRYTFCKNGTQVEPPRSLVLVTIAGRNGEGSLTLYAGAKSPGADKESNWLPAPEGPFSLYIRAYWAEKPVLDGQWKPPLVSRVQ